MAFCRVSKVNDDYVGLSGDIKPTRGIGVGTYWTDVDTGAKFIWFNGTWEDDLTLIYALSQVMKQVV